MNKRKTEKVDPMLELSPEQRVAVLEFAQREGKAWKSVLSDCWMRAGYPGHSDIGHLLQQVRNVHGPAWLRRA